MKWFDKMVEWKGKMNDGAIKKVLVMLLLGILVAPIASGQDAPVWSVDVDRGVYFIRESVNISIKGLYENNYSLDLVNTTSWQTIHLTTREIGPSGTDKFTILLHDEWIIGGEYLINISVDGVVMASRNITIVYDESYLLIYYKERLVDADEYIKRLADKFNEHIDEHDEKIDSLILIILVLLLIIILLGITLITIRILIDKQVVKIADGPYYVLIYIVIFGLTIYALGLTILYWMV